MADTNNMVLIDADELAELRRGYDIYVRMSIPWEAMWNDAYYTHMHPTIPMQLLHPDAKLPQRQHPCDAGADILVAGSFVFKSPDPLRTIHELKAL